jgi:8-oxo-dGTP pyrophosphatase MutT (NUDIX family)
MTETARGKLAPGDIRRLLPPVDAALEAPFVPGPGDGWFRECLPGDEGPPHWPAGPRTPAAVLVALVARPEGTTLILTRRTAHLRDHAGQISLPGGRIERADAHIAAAALREAEEEIGLPPSLVETLGRLPPYDTITGFRVHPVVGWLARPPALAPDPFEVAEVFEVPLAFVLDRANHRRESHRRGTALRYYYVIPYEGRHIWGATAGILVNLARLLKA